jgi:DNA-binding CsgD family transcriptional regulator
MELTSRELRAALDTLQAIGADCTGPEDFARRGVECLPDLIGSDLTTLSTCDLDTGHRAVVSDQPGAISRREIEVFDHYLHVHPLVLDHGRNPAAQTRRVDDLQPDGAFRCTPLFNEYYRKIGIDHVMAVPIHVDRRFLVSFVLNRSGTAFGARDLAEVVRPHLANLYRLAVSREGTRALPADAPFDRAAAPLTPREREVLDWVAAGKTNRDIAAILGASPRTVEKHLERIYEKLGVETRTAAVMRVRAASRADH